MYVMSASWLSTLSQSWEPSHEIENEPVFHEFASEEGKCDEKYLIYGIGYSAVHIGLNNLSSIILSLYFFNFTCRL